MYLFVIQRTLTPYTKEGWTSSILLCFISCITFQRVQPLNWCTKCQLLYKFQPLVNCCNRITKTLAQRIYVMLVKLFSMVFIHMDEQYRYIIAFNSCRSSFRQFICLDLVFHYSLTVMILHIR